MKYPGFILATLILVLVVCSSVAAQTSGSSKARSKPAKSPARAHQNVAARKSRSSVAKRKQAKAVSSRRVQRLSRAFIVSADLNPMGRQLLSTRSRSAYAGVEAYARKHAADDAGSLAWLVAGYAHLLDNDPAKAVAALTRARPHAGDLSDYVDFFLGNANAALGNFAAALATWRDFDTEYPDSLFVRDVKLSYARELTASGRASEALAVLEKYRNPARPDVELAVGRAYLKIGDYGKAVQALRRVYYAYPLLNGGRGGAGCLGWFDFHGSATAAQLRGTESPRRLAGASSPQFRSRPRVPSPAGPSHAGRP